MHVQNKKRTCLFFCGLVVIGVIALMTWQSAAKQKGAFLSSSATASVTNLAAREAHALIQQRQGEADFVILDIRTPAEFQSARLEGAVNLDYYSPDFRAAMAKLAKDKTYFVYCRTGNRSSHTLRLMQELNFHQVYHLTHGIVGWTQESLPVAP